MTTRFDTEPLKAGEECREAFEHWCATGSPVVAIQIPGNVTVLVIRKRIESASETPIQYYERYMAYMYFALETLKEEKAAWNRRTEPSPAEVGSEGVRESDKQLLKFYDVSTLHELIDAQEKHILKLQETARRYLPQQHIATNGGRHG